MAIEELEELNEAEQLFIKDADMKKTKGKGGRPKKDPSQIASHQIFINLTKDEKLKVEKAASDMGISISGLAKISLSKFGAL